MLFGSGLNQAIMGLSLENAIEGYGILGLNLNGIALKQRLS